MQATDGALYGTTYYGGLNDSGTVFKISPDGSGFVSLRSFATGDGVNPSSALIQGVDGKLYGTTTAGAEAYGTLFALATNGDGFEVLHSFGPTSGRSWAGVVQGEDGALYGASRSETGVAFDGVVFRFDIKQRRIPAFANVS